MIIKIDPALPCIALRNGQRCRQPATVATADMVGDTHYIMQPLCAECVTAMARLYEQDQEENDE
jgi:hypothetical protein